MTLAIKPLGATCSIYMTWRRVPVTESGFKNVFIVIVLKPVISKHGTHLDLTNFNICTRSISPLAFSIEELDIKSLCSIATWNHYTDLRTTARNIDGGLRGTRSISSQIFTFFCFSLSLHDILLYYLARVYVSLLITSRSSLIHYLCHVFRLELSLQRQ